MTVPARVEAPASYVAAHALAFGALGSEADFVSADRPLPVTVREATAASAPLIGTSMISQDVGPFLPDLNRPIVVTLSGDWVGRATLLRSVDGGATRDALTVGGASWASFTANINEAVAAETVADATYYLRLAIASGTLAYRVQQ